MGVICLKNAMISKTTVGKTKGLRELGVTETAALCQCTLKPNGVACSFTKYKNI
jgi:hypothetical protein